MKHPFQIATRLNSVMQKWDLQVLLGGFESDQEAKEAGKAIAEWLAARAGRYAEAPKEPVQ